MEYIFPGCAVNSSSGISSSIIFHENQDSESLSSLTSALLLNIVNETATRQLRTVFIRKEAILKYDFVHIHGCSKLVTSNWDNVHFIYLSSQDSLIRWFSRVHMGQRFADLIIVEGLDQFVENTSDSSFFMRLTYLLEDTRQFIHSSTKDTEHGHHCGLIVSSSLTKSCIQKNPSSKLFPQLPAHALRKTYLLQEQNEINCFQLHSVEDSWKLNLKRQSDEIFWISDH